jgi:diguanylate cyclase (GGDEF)-like protein
MRILVADNDISHRAKLVVELQKLGHFVEEAVNEDSVLKICKTKCPDLLLIDINLSGVFGADLVHKIRQLGGSAVWNTIVLMAELPLEETLLKGLECGADDFLSKPLNVLQLQYKLNSAKRHQELKDEIFNMAHDLAIATRALEGVAIQDTMTGIIDVNTFHRMLETEWFKAKKNDYTLALILLDLDYFKAYNEIYGAEIGDQRIKQIAIALKDALPQNYKHIARTTGETFGLLLPNVTAEFAVKLAQDLIQVVADLKLAHKGSACSSYITASAGVSITEQQVKDKLDLLEAADYALYKAKHTGRNQVYFESAKVY